MRLATGQPVTGACKLDIAAGRIAGIWREHRDQPYNDPDTGERSPTRGALQLVFCDLGTPSDGWNAYDELRDQLTSLGVPRHQIRYIHEAKNDADKGRLFAAARAGHVAVLIGSTEKMGVGTNIQARAVAMHLLDCPWRPADQEQREGRILRQGNQNPEVQILRYVVEGSFDAYSWQTVERKARFINQVMRGRLDTREIEDIGDNALSFAEVKALASGDPLILDKAHADAEVTRLSRLERAWQRNHQTLRSTIAAASGRVDTRERALAEVTDALARRTDTRAERFAITINGTTLRERKPAGELLNRWAAAAQPGRTERLAQLGGLHILATVSPDYRNGGRELVLTLEGLAVEPARAPRSRTREPAHAHPPARAPRHHARRARGAPPRRTPSRDPRRTASPRSAPPPVQVRRATRRRAAPPRDTSHTLCPQPPLIVSGGLAPSSSLPRTARSRGRPCRGCPTGKCLCSSLDCDSPRGMLAARLRGRGASPSRTNA